MTRIPHQLANERTRTMWTVLLASPVVYSTYFLVAYFVVEFACRFQGLEQIVLGMRLLLWVELGLSLAALAAIAFFGRLAYQHWQENRSPTDTEEESFRFMSLSGVLLSLLFGLGTLISGVVAVTTAPCPWV